MINLIKKRVVVTGLGLITPIGFGVTENWINLIQNITKPGIIQLSDDAYKTLPCKIAGKIDQTTFNEKINRMNILKISDMKTMSLANMYALVAADEAIKDSKWVAKSEIDSIRAGTSIASGIAGILEVSEAAIALNDPKKKGYKHISPYFVPKILPNLSSGLISIKYNLKGPNHCVSTACAAGTHAILEAFTFIKNGLVDMMVCGATEACIHPVSIAGFSRMRALATKFNDTPNLASRPFDKNRNGFVMSEGAACLVIESLESALKRNAKIYAEILGGGLNSDASHITNPSGEGAFRCMELAINNSDIKAENIDYINAHATSTTTGDLAEINAINKLFENQTINKNSIYISSLKGALGHLLGAAGAAEIVLTILACKHKIIPATKNLKDIDSEIRLSSFLKLNQTEIKLNQDKMIALKNSFGFGGTNASIVLSSY